MKYSAFIRGLMLATALASAQALASENTAPSLAEQLENAVYAEDVLGDLEQATTLYQKIIQEGDKNREIVANALLRLGQCQLKAGDNTGASLSISRIKTEFSDVTETLAAANALEAEYYQNKFYFNPIPWYDGETLEYAIYDENGRQRFYETYVTTLHSTAHGNTTWKKEIIQTSITDKGSRYYQSIVDDQKNAMISHFTQSFYDKGTFITTDNNRVIVDNKDTGNTVMGTRDNDALDEWSFMEILRRLPYHQGYKEQFKMFNPYILEHVLMRIEVLNNNATIRVPAGEYETHHMKVEWLLKDQIINGAEYWISKGEHAKLIQQKRNGNQQKLISEKSLTTDTHKTFRFKDQFTLEIPKEWFIYDLTNKDSDELLLLPTRIQAHEIASQITSKIENNIDWEEESVDLIAKWNIDWAKNYHKTFIVREDSQHSFKIEGLPAHSYLADFKQNGKELLEYRVILLDAPFFYQAYFHFEKDKLKEFKPQIDNMLNSLKIINKK